MSEQPQSFGILMLTRDDGPVVFVPLLFESRGMAEQYIAEGRLSKTNQDDLIIIFEMTDMTPVELRTN